MTDTHDPALASPLRRRLSAVLILLGVLLILVGYFSPWVPHRAAGLAMTGFEIAEWIKFAPEVRSGATPLHRSYFYWPPIAAAVALALLAARDRRWGWSAWLLATLGVLLSLVPVPLLEDVKSLPGIRANLGRLGLMAAGLLAVALAVWRRRLSARLRGVVLVLIAGAGVALVTVAFSAAEPIVEWLFNEPIHPGYGYQLARGAMLLLALAGLLHLTERAG